MKRMVCTTLVPRRMYANILPAGFTYCAIGALFFLDRLPLPEGAKGKELTMETDSDESMEKTAAPGLSSFDTTIQWLVSRLTTSIDEDELNDDDDDEDDGDDHSVVSANSVNNNDAMSAAPSTSTSATSTSSSQAAPEQEHSFEKIRSAPASSLSDRREPTRVVEDPDVSTFDPVHSFWTGCSGRPNKLADTCYVFWVCGSLTVSLTTSLRRRAFACA
jgi:geranylgeranyl transferase type-1 subunit beta